MSERTSNVALYWDFENIQASLVEKKGGREAYGRTKYQQQETLIDIDSVMEFAATFGVVSINRAYCNWQWYGKYRESLLRNGLELIQLFHPGASAKNGGDIKLALDCTEDLLRFPHVDVVVIVGGDSDYLPLAQKVKALGKTLVGIGTQANTNRHWARSCHEFKFYETLILEEETPSPAPTGPSGQIPTPPAPVEPHPDNVVTTPPDELLRRAILRLSGKGGDSWVLKGAIRPMMKRLDPTFDEEQHGARSFGAFIRKFEHLLEVRAGRNDQEIRLRGAGGSRPGEGASEDASERSRSESGRDRHRRDRRREEPADRTAGRVAERIALALGTPGEETLAEGEAFGLDVPEGIGDPTSVSDPSPSTQAASEPIAAAPTPDPQEGTGVPPMPAADVTEDSKPKGRAHNGRRGGKSPSGPGAKAAVKERAPQSKPASPRKNSGRKSPQV
ncbi:MAG TPA: NYN domain-containing protein [Fibrobacteria bacterium]|nr:NYN domain-containing protein [Fibrobacteria bacterium]HOX49942.1 NYN domain-containing protein [Fibrobacteria bacterium]